MNKILRFSLVAALALVSSISFAQTTVTFIGGTDKGNNDDANSHGADQVTKDATRTATSPAASIAHTRLRHSRFRQP